MLPLNSVRRSRIFLAFAFAPLVVPTILVGTRPLVTGGDIWAGGLEELGSGFFMLALFAYVGAIILGIPGFLLLRRLNANSFVSYCLAGAAVVLIFTGAISVITGGIQRGEHSVGDLFMTLAFGFVAGGMAGGVFRAIVSSS